jgi:hypothetical protein
MIEVLQGDITKSKVDAIVNAANSSLPDGFCKRKIVFKEPEEINLY